MARFFVPAGSKSIVSDIPFSVIELLSQLTDEYAIFLGPQFERQADIVIFSPNAVHLIEVKDKRGTIVVDENDRWLVDGEPIVNVFAGQEENPPTQAKNTADALELVLKKIYKKAGKEFKGEVFPYVLVPDANEISRANLSQRYGWVWILTSLKELPNAIAKRNQRAIARTDFAFSAGDIDFIAKSMRMVPTDVINGVRIADNVGIKPETIQSTTPSGQSRPFPSEKKEPRAQPSGKLILTIGISAFLVVGMCIFIGTVLLMVLGGNLAGLLSPTPEFPSRPTIWITSPSPTSVSIPTSVHSPTPIPTFTSIPIPTPTPTPIPALTPTPIPTSNPTVPHSVTGKWSATRNGLTLTVDKIEFSDNGFLIWMTAVNNTKERLSLPLFGYFFVVDNLGNQYEADPFSSTFPTDIAPGATVSGYAKITRRLDSAATSVKVVFTQVFGSLSIDSISVDNIPVPTLSPTLIPTSNPTVPHSAIGKWSVTRNGLTLTVDKIEIGNNGFLVWMTAVNNTKERLSLPLYGYFFVVDNLGNQYEADPFSSTFPTDIAPGATVSGYAKMTRRLDSAATSVKVVFTQVFGSLSIRSISIDNIPVR